MTINITTSSLVSEVRQTSHFETKYIQDLELRDNARAGLEKADELNRCISVADAQLRALLTRYLQTVTQDTVSAGITVPATLSYVLGLSERRDANKCEQLPQLMRDYLVCAALSKYYATVSVTDLASKRGNEAAALGAEIIRILFFKNPPVL